MSNNDAYLPFPLHMMLSGSTFVPAFAKLKKTSLSDAKKFTHS